MLNKLLIFSLIIWTGCNSFSKEKLVTVNNENVNAEDKPINFRFFYRDGGSNNYYDSDYDILVIEKFSPEKLQIAQLVNLAVKYRDTVKSEYPVSRIEFIGEKDNDTFDLKKARVVYEFYPYMVLSVNFENSLEEYKDKKHPAISTLTVWKGNQLSKNFEDNSIDSLIRANPKLDSLLSNLFK